MTHDEEVRYYAYEEVLNEAQLHLDFTHPLIQWLYRKVGPGTPDCYRKLEEDYWNAVAVDLLKDSHV